VEVVWIRLVTCSLPCVKAPGLDLEGMVSKLRLEGVGAATTARGDGETSADDLSVFASSITSSA
jgi:hypothetical protein